MSLIVKLKFLDPEQFDNGHYHGFIKLSINS